jgi:hypothetical protein
MIDPGRAPGGNTALTTEHTAQTERDAYSCDLNEVEGGNDRIGIQVRHLREDSLELRLGPVQVFRPLVEDVV